MSSFGYSCTPCNSCLNSGLFGVGYIKQPLRRVNRKTESPRYLYSGCFVLWFLLGQTVLYLKKNLFTPFVWGKLLGIFCYDIYNIHLGRLLESNQEIYHEHLLGHKTKLKMYTLYKALYWPHSCWIRKLFNSIFRKQLFTPVILVFEWSISIWVEKHICTKYGFA